MLKRKSERGLNRPYLKSTIIAEIERSHEDLKEKKKVGKQEEIGVREAKRKVVCSVQSCREVK